MIPKDLIKGLEEVEMKEHPSCDIVKIGLNIKKSQGGLRRLAVVKSPVKDHRLTLVWKTCKEYCCPGWPQNKTVRMWKEGLIPRPCFSIEKTIEHESDNNTNCDWCFWYSNSRIIKGTGGLGSWRSIGDHPNDSIIENGQNTEKNPRDLRRLALTQTPVKTISYLWYEKL